MGCISCPPNCKCINLLIRQPTTKHNVLDIKKCEQLLLTVTAEHEWGGWTLDSGLCDGVGHHTGVIANIWGLHFGDVQIACLLRDEAASILLHICRVLIEDPGKYEICGRRRKREFSLQMKKQEFFYSEKGPLNTQGGGDMFWSCWRVRSFRPPEVVKVISR